MKELKDIRNKISKESGIHWVKASRTVGDGRAVPYLIQKLIQYGPLVTNEVKRVGNAVHYQVDEKLAKTVEKEVTLYMEGFMKGVQHAGRI